MGRRRNTSVGDEFVKAGGAMPPMITVAIAVVLFLVAEPLFQALFSKPIDTSKPADVLAGNLTNMFVMVGTLFFKYFVPLMLLLGAFVGWMKRRIAGKVLNKARNLIDNMPEHLASAEQALRQFSWRQFEQLTSAYFSEHGFRVHVTDDGPDGGVDIKLYKDGKTYLVQCKHWRSSKVPVNVVRELFGVMVAEGADGGFVVASGYFTHDAEVFARGKKINLVDGNAILNHRPAPTAPPAPPTKPKARVEPTLTAPASADISRFQRKVSIEPAVSVTPPPDTSHFQPKPVAPKCPKCSNPMVLRTAQKGANAGMQFYGCVHFPHCRGVTKV